MLAAVVRCAIHVNEVARAVDCACAVKEQKEYIRSRWPLTSPYTLLVFYYTYLKDRDAWGMPGHTEHRKGWEQKDYAKSRGGFPSLPMCSEWWLPPQRQGCQATLNIALDARTGDV